MCLILFAYQEHPTYKLIVAANRDEFYERPTAAVHYWDDYPYILAGRDLKMMGTWMGVTKQGRFSALTNYRDPRETTAGKRSRGELVADFLKGNDYPEKYMNKIAKNYDLYPGYNLLAGDLNHLYYYSNIENKIQQLKPGFYGVSNHLLNTNWPKVRKGKKGLATIIHQKDRNVLVDELFSLLENAEAAPDDQLPHTGVSLEWERLLSPMFIKSAAYGTRSSTILLMADHELYYHERVYSKEGLQNNMFIIPL